MPKLTSASFSNVFALDKTTGNPYILIPEFEWDIGKAESNRRKHGVTYDQAVTAFADLFSVELIDERQDYGEERVNLLGMCLGMLLIVTYTERDDRIRIISARKANGNERDNYFRENSR